MTEIKVFAPASIANLSCGYDILGVCLDNIGDEITVRKTKKKGITIKKFFGQNLSTDISINVAGVSATALLNESKVDCGFEIEIHKGIKPGSGIGSSAASSAGSVFAINKLIGEPYSNKELIKFAMQGEMAASGSKHADNVAAVLLGGFTFVRNSIKDKVSIKNMIEQSANLGAFISGLYTEDYDLIRRSVKDVVIEPLRSVLIPKFEEIKSASINSGALSCGISGSGPSVFAICKGITTANKVGEAMTKVYQNLNLEYDIHISCVNDKGIRILNYK
jgi:homoserine kinase